MSVGWSRAATRHGILRAVSPPAPVPAEPPASAAERGVGGSDIALVAPADWSGILTIERLRHGDHAYDPTFVRMIPLVFGRTCWVARADGAVMGYVLGAREDADPRVGWVLSVAVAADGAGLGTRLTAACVAGLEALGVERVRLTVAPDNARAIAVYAKLGFAEVGLDPDFFGPGEARLVMERRGL